MTPALIQLIAALAPLANRWGTEATNAIIDAIANASKVAREEIVAAFEPFRKYASLTDFEKEAGVVVKSDGSVDAQPS